MYLYNISYDDWDENIIHVVQDIVIIKDLSLFK